jgi:hypothetical protein
MKTYEPFANSDLVPQGSEEPYKAVSFHLEAKAGGGFERVVFVEARERDGSYQLLSRVTKGRTDTGGRWGAGTIDVARAHVSRSDESSVQVRFRESALGLRKHRFRWAARTAHDTSSTGSGSSIIFDYAPDGRLVRESW